MHSNFAPLILMLIILYQWSCIEKVLDRVSIFVELLAARGEPSAVAPLFGVPPSVPLSSLNALPEDLNIQFPASTKPPPPHLEERM